jgi:N-acetylglucosaminyl-diphospho-decaprenol L-rhamnosyltransferase
MSAAARARAEERLDIDETRRRYGDLIEELARAGTPVRRLPVSGAPNRRGAGLALLTVTHDSEPQLEALLDSVARHLPAAEVIVVDSGSSDGGLALARRWRDGAARVLGLADNVGFGRAVNRGLELVSAPVAAVLNPDVELPDASLAAAAREALEPADRLIAPLVLRPDGQRQDSAQREPGDPLLLVHAFLPGAGLPRRLAAAVEPWRAPVPRRVGWAVGCCLVARTELLRRLGPFDPRVFLYGEDLDLGLRAADAGVESWFWPAARVVHHGAHSTAAAFGGEPLGLLARRRREVVRERRGPARARVDDLLQLMTFADRLALKRLAGRSAMRERAQLDTLRRLRREGR